MARVTQKGSMTYSLAVITELAILRWFWWSQLRLLQRLSRSLSMMTPIKSPSLSPPEGVNENNALHPAVPFLLSSAGTKTPHPPCPFSDFLQYPSGQSLTLTSISPSLSLPLSVNILMSLCSLSGIAVIIEKTIKAAV